MGLRKFFLRLALISAPFSFVFGVVVVVDPYNYFNWSHVVDDAVKLKNLYHDGRTMAFSNLMWKMKEYRRTPVPNVLIGDSRLSYFDLEHLAKVTGKPWYNFGVPGGNHRTAADVFGYIDSIASPGTVWLQVSFRNMAAGQDYDLYSEPFAVESTPGLYVSNRRVLAATALALKAFWSPESVQYDVLAPDHWNNVVDMETEAATNFIMDTSFYARLESIARHCRLRGTELLLIEWPAYHELHGIRSAAGLDPLQAGYRERLGSIATYVDLDTLGNPISADRNNYRDPLHLTVEAQRKLVDALMQ
ncbi:MAG: hypothetical protein IPO17_01290 [Flavobacteriales bacterium]|nr:hypothetical protein [Flavobacteriales bacterium]